jgi:Tol biopolymer transport system component
MGGAATPVNGAASTQFEEFYPAYSPDDRFIAYTAVPAGEVMYANPHEEIYAIAGTGGTAQRLKANDPPACSGKTSPGINNHWPKWSPDVANGPNGSKYYWLIFSSNRADLPPVQVRQTDGSTKAVLISQLYLAPVIVTETGDVGSFPAVYLWNQPTDRVNTTPAWESFVIPVIP